LCFSYTSTPPFEKGGLGGISKNEQPFALPMGWEWVRLGDVSINRDAERIPVSSDERQHREKIYDYYGASGVIDKIDNFLFDKTLLLIGEDGANLINRSTPIAFLAHGKYWVNNHAHVIDAYNQELMDYLCLYINSISLEAYVTGTAQPKMNQAKLNSIFVRLPPLAEQQRIVAKVDELMQLCDRLEEKQNGSQAMHRQLVSCLLTTLTEATDAQAFQAAWSRIAANFDCLFTTEHSIEQLKQTILQLAVMGKLVPQNPNDEPASELLNKIATEKARLITEGKIKKQNPLPKISEDEKLFALPNNWLWCLFCSVADIQSNLVNPDLYGDMPHIAPNHIEKNSGILLEYNTVSADSVKSSKHYFYAGQILYSKIRPNLNKLTTVDFEGLCSADMYPIRAKIDTKYLCLYMRSSYFVHQAISDDNRVAMPKVNQERLNSISVPVPPLKEQHRIVTKVDELMTLCEQLKTKLATAQTLQQQLADTLVQQAVA
jgi:type I restriction enzyme S subunit